MPNEKRIYEGNFEALWWGGKYRGFHEAGKLISLLGIHDFKPFTKSYVLEVFLSKFLGILSRHLT